MANSFNLPLLSYSYVDGCLLFGWLLISKHSKAKKYEKQTAHRGIRERAVLFPLTIPGGLFTVQFYNYSQYQHVYSFLDATQMLL